MHLGNPQLGFNAYLMGKGSIIRSGLMAASTVGLDQTGAAVVSRDNTSRRADINVVADRFVAALLSTFRLSGGFAVFSSGTLRDGIEATTTSINWNIALSASTMIGSNIVAEPRVSYSRSTNSVSGYSADRTALGSVEASIGLNAYAFSRKLEIKAEPSFSRHDIAAGAALNNFFLDASLRWKEKKWEAELRGRNITNRRRAGYSRATALNVFTSITLLRGAEALATFTWRF